MSRPFTPIEWRFWPKVKIRVGCWEWVGSKDRLGYGRINSGGHTGTPILAHRLAYESTIGPIPEGMDLDHKCNNPSCVNPDHLRPCTHAENMRNQAPARGISGLKGACWDRSRKSWISTITVDGVHLHLGRFKTKEDAHMAYRAASLIYHGDFSNFGAAS